MPVYIAQSTSRETTPYFALKGLASLAPCSVSSTVIYGTTTLEQPAYAEYATNIGAFMSATALGVHLSTGLGKYSIKGYGTEFHPRLPSLYFKPSAVVPMDKLEAIAGKISEEGVELEQAGKVAVMILTKPTLETADKLANSQSRDPAKQGYITPSDLVVARYLDKLIALFLSVHTYEAKETVIEATEDKPRKVKFERLVQEDHTSPAITSTESRVHPPLPERSEVAITAINNYVQNRGNSRDDKAALNEFVQFFVNANTSGIVTRADLAIPAVSPVAKPSPHPFTVNCGGVRDVPALPGLLFPYFDRMMIPDKTSLPYLYVRSGFYKIASSDDSLQSRLSSLGQSIAGQMYVHLFIGICLALETKTRLYVVTSGSDYLGFTLHGTKFTINIGGVEYTPVSHKDLAAEVATLSSHDEALEKICSILSGLKSRGGRDPEPVPVSSISGTSRLAKVMASKEKIPSGLVDEFNAAAKKLRFAETFLPMEAGTIKNAVIAMGESESTDYIKHPKFIDAKLDYVDPVTTIWASFGPEAPSPLNKKGSQYRASALKKKSDETVAAEDAKRKAERAKREAKAAKQKKTIGAEPPLSVLTLYQDPPKDNAPAKFLLPKKPTSMAISDWKKFMNKGMIQMDEKERAASHRCVVVLGVGSSILWKALCYARTIKGGVTAGDDDDDDSERAKKKAKFSLFDDFGMEDAGKGSKGKGKVQDDDEDMKDASDGESDSNSDNFSVGGEE